MRELEIYYPEWKEKALTFSYDDGQVFDRRLVELMNRYGLKGTFHLNSGRLSTEKHIAADEVKTLYAGHEVACHGYYHEFPTCLNPIHLLQELQEDRLNLEKLTGQMVRGCSYAYGDYDDQVIGTFRQVGLVYSRTVENSGSFRMPVDFMKWHPTCHHNDAFSGDLVERFLAPPPFRRLPLLYIWGHSFEFERQNTWEKMEQLCQTLSGHENIWYTTNLDYMEYVTAVRGLVVSADGKRVVNPYKTPVYVKLNGEKQIL